MANQRRWAGVGVAVFVTVASGVVYRLLQRHYSGVVARVRLERGTLDDLDWQIGPWEGAQRALDDRTVEATDTDDHVYRAYSRTDGARVLLYIAYGVQVRDLAPHRPEVCYPSAGWTRADFELRTIRPPLVDPIQGQLQVFEKSGLSRERVVVLHYYIVDGTIVPDMNRLRDHVWSSSTDLKYVAQVQITAEAALRLDRAETWVEAFAVESAEPIRRLLNDKVAEAEAALGQEHKP